MPHFFFFFEIGQKWNQTCVELSSSLELFLNAVLRAKCLSTPSTRGPFI